MGRLVVGLAIALVLIVVAAVFLFFLAVPTTVQPGDGPDGPGVELIDGAGDFDGSGGTGSGNSSGDGATSGGSGKGASSAGSGVSSGTESALAGTESAAATIHGEVFSLDETPVAAAALRFLDAEGRALGTGQSAADGTFTLRISELVAGEIEATAAMHATVLVPWFPAVDEDEDATAAAPGDAAAEPTDGTAADATDGAAELSEELVRIELPYETAIAGHVTLPEDLVEKPFYVTIQRYSGPYGWHEPELKAFEDKAGAFYIGGLSKGTFHLWAHAKGAFRSALLEVTVAENERRTGADFTLEPGFELTCRAFDKRNGRALSDVLVFLPKEHIPGTVNFPERRGVDASVRNAAITDSSGTTLLRDLPPGEHVVRFLHSSFKPVDVTATVGDNETVIEATLEEGTGIRGQALDETGAPYEGAVVMAIQMTMGDRAMTQITQGKVDETGNYSIPNLLAGSYIVFAQLVEGQDGKTTMTTVPADKDAIVDFVEIQELATLRGWTKDARGEPVPNLYVTCMNVTEGADFKFDSVVSDAEGKYEVRNLEIGTYMIGVGAGTGGNFTVGDTFEVKAHIDYDRDLTFHDLSIEGVVVSKSTKLTIPSSELLLFDPEDPERFLGRAETDDKGAFDFGGLPPGGYIVYVRAPGHQPLAADPVFLREGAKAQPLKLEVELGAAVAVSVQAPDGSPADGALVHLIDEKGELVNQGLAPLTAGGRYSFYNLVPGVHVVRVTLGEAEGAGTFVAKAGETHEVEIQLQQQ